MESLALVDLDAAFDSTNRGWRRWRRVTTHDGFKVLVLTRLRESARAHHVPGANHLLRLATRVLYGIDIGNEVEFGVGVRFTHTVGSVIGGPSKVGARVQFMGSNTVGTAKDNGCPVIGDDVVLGCGARVLGPITVGRAVVIGANAVVLCDVPDGATAIGIPARVAHGQRRRGLAAEPALEMWVDVEGAYSTRPVTATNGAPWPP